MHCVAAQRLAGYAKDANPHYISKCHSDLTPIYTGMYSVIQCITDVMGSNRDREKPHGLPLPHHRANVRHNRRAKAEQSGAFARPS